MERRIPLEPVGSAAALVVLRERPIPHHGLGVGAEQREAVTEQTSQLPGEVRSHTEAADVAAQGNLPGRRELSDGPKADEGINPVLAPLDGRSVDDIDLAVDVRVPQPAKALQRPGPWLPGSADRPAAKAVQPADLDNGQIVRGIRSQRAHRDVVIPEIDIGDVQEDTDVITPGFTIEP